MKEILISLFSGIVGIFITIGYQHFFAPSQSFAIVINGEEVVVTASEYMGLAEQNGNLQNEVDDLQEKYQESINVNSQLQKELEDSKSEVSSVQKELEDSRSEVSSVQKELEDSKSEVSVLQKELEDSKNEVSSLQEEIDGLEEEVKSLQEKSEEYERKYGKNLNEDIETVSIIDLETFQGSEFWWNTSDTANSKIIYSSNFIDTYGNEYPSANVAKHYHLNTKDKYSATYLLDYNYSKCEGKIAWPKSDKNETGSIWIEFYSGDELFYQTEPITASDRALSFEFSVEGVEKLTVVKKASRETGIIYIIYPYFNLVK